MNYLLRALVLFGWLLLLTQCAKGAAFTEQDLQQAQAQWNKNGLDSYRLTLEISGDKVETGVFVVEVEQNKIQGITRNGQAITTTDTFYTIEGMFQFLENELELGKEPRRYFGSAPGARIYMRAHFDPKQGFPTRYLRAITDTKHNIAVEVKSLEKL